ncbi:MAG: type 4a pilus biogenesis protein PilO [Verrucomicrobia bacterium]|nr:type 4a pilus biogenesis protein PilO [Verrucomicrobiota bacterium]
MALSQREKILAGASAAVVFVCLNWFAIGPVLDTWRETQDKLSQTKLKIKGCQTTLAMEPQWKAQLGELRTRLQRSDPGQSGADIITRIEGVGSQLGFNFNQRAPAAPVDRDRYTEKSATFTFQGQWPGLVRFLFALTKQPEIYRVTSLRLRAEVKDPTQLAGDMNIVTYYLAVNESGAARKKPVDTPAPERQDKP